MGIYMSLLSEIILSLRIYAMYGGSKKIAFLLVSGLSLSAVSTMVILSELLLSEEIRHTALPDAAPPFVSLQGLQSVAQQAFRGMVREGYNEYSGSGLNILFPRGLHHLSAKLSPLDCWRCQIHRSHACVHGGDSIHHEPEAAAQYPAPLPYYLGYRAG